jgi:hypothetical protein
MKCPSGQICSESECACPGGFKLCADENGAAASCANVKVDEANCGDCGNVCDGRCIQGDCR